MPPSRPNLLLLDQPASAEQANMRVVYLRNAEAVKLAQTLRGELTGAAVFFDPERLETTITADNAASNRLFARFAERHGAACERTALFTPELYPDGHETEYLYRIGPLDTAAEPRTPALAGAAR